MKIRRPNLRVPDVGKMAQYKGFTGDEQEYKKAKKRITTYITTFGSIALILAVIIIYIVHGESQSMRDSQSSDSQYESSSSESSTGRYDKGIVTVSKDYTTVNGVTVSGTYNPDNYELSVAISNELSLKYSDAFKFYYIVAEAEEDDAFWMTFKGSDKVFKAKPESGGVRDNLYSLSYLGPDNTQLWNDNYGDLFLNLQGFVITPPDAMLASGGLDFGSLNQLQVRGAPDVLIFVSGDYAGGSANVEKMFQGIAKAEGQGFRESFTVTVVSLESETGVYQHLYQDKDVTAANYQDMLDVAEETQFTVNEDGSVAE